MHETMGNGKISYRSNALLTFTNIPIGRTVQSVTIADCTMDKPYFLCHIEKSVDFTIFDTKWLPCSAKCVALGRKSNGNGVLNLFELNNGELDKVRELEQKSALKSCSFGASSIRKNHIAVVTFDGQLQVLDLERLNSEPIYSVSAHKGIVNCLDAIGGGFMINCGAPEIATGGADGFVKIWDVRQKDIPVASIAPFSSDKGKFETIRECWTIGFGDSFNNEERVLCAGYDNGDVKMLDLRQMKIRWETNIRNGICRVEFDRRDIPMNKLVVTTLEGGLHVYDLRTQHPTKGFACVSEADAGRSLGTKGVISGAKATVWTAQHLPQNRELFVTCGGTGAIRLWHYKYPVKRFKPAADGCNKGVAGSLDMLQATSISSQPINTFDWSSDRIGLAVCGSFDQAIRILVTTNLHLY